MIKKILVIEWQMIEQKSIGNWTSDAFLRRAVIYLPADAISAISRLVFSFQLSFFQFSPSLFSPSLVSVIQNVIGFGEQRSETEVQEKAPSQRQRLPGPEIINIIFDIFKHSGG